LSERTAEGNTAEITRQLRKIFTNAQTIAGKHGDSFNWSQIKVLDNNKWWNKMVFTDFMSQVARNMRLGPMLARDRSQTLCNHSRVNADSGYSVKGRLNSPEGIDLASFLYQAIQAYDFYQLQQSNNCELQIGGSDQWGNITAGIDLIERLSPPESNCTSILGVCLS